MKCGYFDTRSMIIYRTVQKANKRTGMYNQEKHHPSSLLYTYVIFLMMLNLVKEILNEPNSLAATTVSTTLLHQHNINHLNNTHVETPLFLRTKSISMVVFNQN